jgi:uncharacterized protein
MGKEKLIIFAKAPVPGRVKTRLVPPLTYAEAALFYRRWARDVVQAAVQNGGFEIEVAYDAHPRYPNPNWLEPQGENLSYFPQVEGNLGERLQNVFERSFENGLQRIVVIGTDSPGLPMAYIQKGFQALLHHDLVLGPTRDGGYYLIGLRGNPAPGFFDGIPWSTSGVLTLTLRVAAELGMKVHLLPEYFDVDTPEDLKMVSLKS